MRKILSFFLFFIFVNATNNCIAQGDLRLQISDSYSSCYVGSIQNDKNGGLIITGLYGRPSVNEFSKLYINDKSIPIVGNRGFYLLKLDEKQEIIWGISIELKYTNSSVTPQIILDDSSNIYLTGKFQGQLIFDSKNSLESATGDDFIAKYTAKGELKWMKKWTGTSNTFNYKNKIDKEQNLYFFGKFNGNLEFENKILLKTIQNIPQSYLLVLDRNGKFVKSESFDPNIDINSIEINEKKEVFIAGDFSNEVAIQGVSIKSAGGKDIFYAKFDDNFKLQWLKSAGGGVDDNCRGLKVDDIGNVYLAGFVTNQANFDELKLDIKSQIGKNIFLTQINDQTGKLNWIRNIEYGGGNNSFFQGPTMTVDILQLNEKKEVYMAGVGVGYITNNKDFYFYNDRAWVQYLLKYDKNGSLSESKGEFNRESYSPANWHDLITKQGGYLYSVFNVVDSPRGGVSALVKVFKSTETDNCKENKVLIQRASSGVFSLANRFIDNYNFIYQWYRNGKYLPNENKFTLNTNEIGYYSLKLINKTNSSCQIKSSNSIGIYPLTSEAITLFYADNSLNVSFPGFKIEWYRDNILIDGLNSKNYFFPTNGIYKVKNYFERGVIIETNEVAVKDGVALRLTKETFLDDGDFCKPVPYLKVIIEGQNLQTNTKLKYQWFLNGNSIKDSTNTHFKPITTGDYQVSILDLATNKTYTSGKYKIVIEDFPKSLPINKIEDNCGAKALLKVDDSFMQRNTFQSIVWRLDGKDIPDENYPFLNVNKSGYYTFSVKYIDNSNGTACNYNSFVNFDKKTDFKLNVGYAYAGSGCVVDSFKVFVPYNKNYTYEWTKNDVPIKNQASNELFVQDKSRYKGIVRREDGCVNETDEISLKGCTSVNSDKFLMLNPPPISADKTSFYTNEMGLLSSNACSNVNLQWLKDTQAIVGATQKTLEVKESGNYALQIEKLGCTATTNTIKISIETVLAVGEELPEIDIEVYPNPTEDNLIISTSSQINSPITVKMTNILGRLIKNYDILQARSQIIDIKTLPEGMYFLIFETNGKRVVKKIIKKD